MANFDVELNDEVENFTVEFGEVQRITVDDFDKLRNRPSYAGQTMTHETNIPEVPTAVSQLTNDADYQTGSEVESAISTAVGGEKDAREQADAGLSRDIGVVDGKVDAEADARERADIALQGAIDDEETARKNADNGLQGQIDAITSSSDVVDIVGTYAELLQYPTAGLGDKDVIKVLQDETHNDAMSYYRWNKSSSTWSYIGSEGPYYTKSETNTLLGDKQDTLTAGSNITISSNNTISATDTTYTAGNGLTLTGTEFSADTTVLQPKLTAGDGINISTQNVISADIDPADFFTASETVDGTGSEMTLNNTIQAKIKSVQMDGDTFQQTYSGAQLFDYTDTTTVSPDYSVDSNGWITCTCDNSAGTGTKYFNYWTNPLALTASTSYALVIEVKSITGVGYIEGGGSNSTSQVSGYFFNFSNMSSGNTYISSIVSKENVSGSNGLRTYLRFGAGQSGSITFRISVIVDTSITPETFVYQPYVGGIPAPSPSYPMPISVVTSEQTVAVTGKNLWGNISSYSRSTNGIDFVTNADGTITASGTATATAYSVLAGGAVDAGAYLPLQAGTYTLSEKNGNKVQAVVAQSGGAIIADTSTSEVTFTLTQTTNVTIRASITSGTAITGTLTFYPMLETGSSPTSYQPYQLQSYTIELGSNELCKIGTYQDKIYTDGSDWYLHKELGKLVLDGTENWIYNNVNAVFVLSEDHPHSGDGTAPVSTHFIGQANVSQFSELTNNKCCALMSSSNNRLLFKNTSIADADIFKTWLGSNNTTVCYPLATPTNTKITDATLISELDALADALGYKDKTIITVSATGTNLPAILEVSAYRNSLAGVLGVIGRAEAA